jgi:integrase
MISDDFNPDAGTIRVRTSKSGKPRHVVLTQEGRDFLAGQIAGRPGSARLFVRKTGSPPCRSGFSIKPMTRAASR